MTKELSIDAPAVAAEAAALRERLAMTEVEFREFYSKTARPLKAYLTRITGSQSLADDLLQESYYRMLRVKLPSMDVAQRRNYLYRVATNLTRDHFRQASLQVGPAPDSVAATSMEGSFQAAKDIRKALGEIRPEERQLVWLAYVEGASHREIAAITGLKEASVRPLLYRVRQKLAGLLRGREEA